MIDKTWVIISALKKIDTKKRNGKSEVSIKLERENLLRRIICFCKRYMNADCTSKFIWFFGLWSYYIFLSKTMLKNSISKDWKLKLSINFRLIIVFQDCFMIYSNEILSSISEALQIGGQLPVKTLFLHSYFHYCYCCYCCCRFGCYCCY